MQQLGLFADVAVTLRLMDKDNKFYDFTSSVDGVREHVWQLLAAGVGGKE